MLISNQNRLVGLLSCAVGLIILAGCQMPKSQPRPEADDLQGATFYVDTNSAVFTRISKFDESVKIAQARELSFKVCIKGAVRGEALMYQKFEVRGGLQPESVKTDAQGCLIWNEEIKFNPGADEKFVTLNREIVGLKPQAGLRSFEIVINPWAAQVFSTQEARLKEVTPAKETAKALSAEGQQSQLWIDGVRLTLGHQEMNRLGGVYLLDLSAQIQNERTGINGERVTQDITQGQVQLRGVLYCTTSTDSVGEKTFILAEFPNLNAEVLSGGRIGLATKLTLPALCNNNAQYRIALAASLASGKLKTFQGVFHLGTLNSLAGGVWATLVPTLVLEFRKDPTWTIERHLKDLAAQKINPLEANDKLQRNQVEISRLEFQSKISNLNGNGKTRERVFQVSLCLKSSLNQQPLRQTLVQIKKLNGEIVKNQNTTQTQLDGCLSFEDSVTYDHLGKECWLEKTLEVQSADLGLNQQLTVHLNPWAQGPLWAVDGRFAGGEEALRCVKNDSQIFFDSYSFDYSAGRFSFSIDSFLNLNYFRIGSISLSPRLVRGSFTSENGAYSSPENLPPGPYLLRYALVDSALTNFDLLQSAEDKVFSVGHTVVQVREDGKIADQIKIWTPAEALVSLGLINQFIIEMEPLAFQDYKQIPDNQLEKYVEIKPNLILNPYVARFSHNSEGGSLRRLDKWKGKSLVKELRKIFEKSNSDRLAKSLEHGQKAKFAADENLQIINLSQGSMAQNFRLQLANSSPGQILGPNRQAHPQPVPSERLAALIKGEVPSRMELAQLCGYFFNTVWTETQPGGKTILKASNVQKEIVYGLQAACMDEAFGSPHKAFDIDLKAFLVKPKIVSSQSNCRSSAEVQDRCSGESDPVEVLLRNITVGSNFNLSRDYSISQSLSAGLGLSAGYTRIVGINGQIGYNISATESQSQGQSVSFGTNMSLIIESLKFKIQAEDAERCLSLRLNPNLFDRAEKVLFFFKQKSRFAQYLNSELTTNEIEKAKRRGLLLCEGKNLGHALELQETYHIVRPDGPSGWIGDERSRVMVQPLYLSMRGVRDLGLFLSRVSGARALPDSFQAEAQALNMTNIALSRSVRLGSDSAPGVYSIPPKY